MLAVATSLGAAAKVLGKKKEEGRMETRCKANLTRGTNNSLNLFNNYIPVNILTKHCVTLMDEMTPDV